MNHHKNFDQSLKDINKLASTPIFFKNIAITSLQQLLEQQNIANTHKIPIQQTIDALNNVKDQSIVNAYKIIYNQCLVLTVSALEDTISKYFINYIQSNYKNISNKEKIKFTLEELIEYQSDQNQYIGKLILEKDNSINFQDFQSTIRSLEKYTTKKFNIDDEIKKYTIFYQQCRHCIVHNDGKIDNYFLEKTKKENCNIKNYSLGEKISLENEDWENIQNYFSKFVKQIIPPVI